MRAEQAGEQVPEELAAEHAKADKLVLSKLRERIGLDALEAVYVGAAPTPAAVLEFFHALGIPVAELWGLSESTGSGALNLPGKIKIGTVGQVTPGMELKLADDGEILIRGAQIMKGYRNMPEKTAETIDDEGWLHTGDIGELDDEGYLRIVDRKKELIITAGGKNISPANLEAKLKAHPLIGTACVIGDQRPFLSALIVLDPDVAPAWAKQQGIEDASLEALSKDERVREEVQKGVDGLNAPGVEGGGREEVHRPGRGLAARRRRADTDDEAQAQAGRGEVRLADRGDVHALAAPGRLDRPGRRYAQLGGVGTRPTALGRRFHGGQQGGVAALGHGDGDRLCSLWAWSAPASAYPFGSTVQPLGPETTIPRCASTAAAGPPRACIS